MLKLIKYFLWGIIFVFYSTSFFPMNFLEISQLFSGKSFLNYILFIILGIFSICIISLYDFILRAEFKLPITFMDTLKIGWISNTIGNFIGESPTRYAGISSILYQTKGIDSNKATLISIIKNTLFKIEENNDGEIEFLRLSVKTKVYLILSILFKWVISYFLLLYIFISFNVNISILNSFLLFTVASLLGRFSRVPGDIGVFAIIFILFSKAKVENLLVALIVYRFVYSIIPLLITLVFLSSKASRLKSFKLSREQKKLIHLIAIQSMAALTFSVGILLIISGTFNNVLYEVSESLESSVYMVKLTSLGLGLLLLVLSDGILHRVKTSYYTTLVFLSLALILSMFHLKLIGQSIFLIIVIAILIPAKSSFFRENGAISIKYIFGNFVFLLLVTLIYFVSYINALDNKGFKDIIDDLQLRHFIYYLVILVVASVFANLTRRKHLEFTQPTEKSLDKVSEFLKKYDGNSMTHLIFLKDKMLFFAQSETVLIAYRPFKDKLLALGDPIGDEANFKEAINDFRLFADKFDMSPVFYEVNEKFLPIYHDNGFNFLKVGEEAILELDKFTLAGKKAAPLRTIKNKMNRNELEFELVMPPFNQDFVSTLKDISDKWLDGKNEKGYSLGFFDENYISLAPIATIKVENQIIAFATIMPVYHKEKLAIDLMRLIPHPPNGTMDALFIGIIEWAIENNYKYFILGKAPLSNVGTNRFSTSKEKLVRHFYKYGNKIYSFIGLRRFKEKFYPDWEGVYLAYPKSINLSATILQLAKIIGHK
ncbi:hypothetical protein AN396_10575 [Candidatus Epulonipiscium fishelsonii]|uniref:Uncharacterized protein n=1 Tax=Candidatus Epulonipiscium fishelsonii TaxID=77094 RepID=A0ACC8X8T6_9FIRM|nr:hypothetical protein AN396_10575 [Epulopiscium sp. SCG-B11WGA-EpuloA1]